MTIESKDLIIIFDTMINRIQNANKSLNKKISITSIVKARRLSEKRNVYLLSNINKLYISKSLTQISKLNNDPRLICDSKTHPLSTADIIVIKDFWINNVLK
jgi:hypothetical protein